MSLSHHITILSCGQYRGQVSSQARYASGSERESRAICVGDIHRGSFVTIVVIFIFVDRIFDDTPDHSTPCCERCIRIIVVIFIFVFVFYVDTRLQLTQYCGECVCIEVAVFVAIVNRIVIVDETPPRPGLTGFSVHVSCA